MLNVQNTKGCPAELDLYNYAVDSLVANRKNLVEKHLMVCDLCLKEVMQFKRIVKSMSQDVNIPVPAELKERVIQLASEKDINEPIQERVTEFILSLTEKGIKFVKTNFLPEGVEVNISKSAVPAYAFRNDVNEKDESISIEQKIENIGIKLQITRGEGDRSTMNVIIMKDKKPLKKTRITLYMDNRLLLSRITSNNGNAEFPEIILGNYSIKIPKEDLKMKFRILPHTT